MTPADLRAARKRLGLTQAQLACRLELESDRAIRRYENGDRPIPGPVKVAVELMLEKLTDG